MGAVRAVWAAAGAAVLQMHQLQLLYFVTCISGASVGTALNSSPVSATVLQDGQTDEPAYGDRCRDSCSAASHARCLNGTCVCPHKYPVVLKHSKQCVSAALYGDECIDTAQCQHHDDNAECKFDLQPFKQCRCLQQYEMKDIQGLHISKLCFPSIELIRADMPTFLGMGLALSMFSAVMCLVLKIFSRARYARARRYANAAIPPPLTVSETYAAFALTGGSTGSISPRSERYQSRRKSTSSRRTSCASYRTSSGSRYPSMTSLRSGELLRSASYIRPGSRRPSMSSLRSGSFAIVEPRGLDTRDHYLVYIRGPTHSLTSETTSTSCDSIRGHQSTDQFFAIYHPLPEHAVAKELVSRGGSNSAPGVSGATKTGILRLPSAGPSESLRSMSTEDVFLEEQEEEEEEEEDQTVLLEVDEESEGDNNAPDTKLVK